MRRPRARPHAFRRSLLALTFACGVIPSANADVALLRNGRSLAVTDYRMDGDRVVLMMEGGGEIALLNDQIIAIRREPPAPLPASVARSAPSLPPASPDETLLSRPPPSVVTSLEPRAERGAPMELVPGAVFDRDALRDLAGRIARKHHVDEALVLAVIEVESRYDAFAVSPRGAMGLMQLMPETASRFAVRNVFNPVENVDGGVRYLKELLERYSGQVRLALAAYNAGEEAVDQFKGIPPFRETQQYVGRVLRALSR